MSFYIIILFFILSHTQTRTIATKHLKKIKYIYLEQKQFWLMVLHQHEISMFVRFIVALSGVTVAPPVLVLDFLTYSRVCVKM